jgi:hypothetical protein
MGEMNAMKFSRREFARILGTAASLRWLHPQPLRAERLAWEAWPPGDASAARRYRADAEIVLLSVTVLHRSGVGGGRASWSEAPGMRLLEFSGYSLPERAAGLRRLGFIREMARTDGDGSESIYFGLMTSSPEESATEAHKALHDQSKSSMYSTVEGRVAPGAVETLTAHFTAPAQISPSHYEELVSMARQALSVASAKAPEFDPRQCEPTFLQALARLLESDRTDTRYVYNGRLYRLWLKRGADAKATAYFREKKLIGAEASVVRAEGRLRREPSGKETDFQIWVEQGARRPLPLRIRYQAKSYLRLVFEAEAAG